MKIDGSDLNSEIVIEDYDLVMVDRSKKGGGVACFIKQFCVLQL